MMVYLFIYSRDFGTAFILVFMEFTSLGDRSLVDFFSTLLLQIFRVFITLLDALKISVLV